MIDTSEYDAQIKKMREWLNTLISARKKTRDAKDDINMLYKKMKKNEEEINCWYGGYDWEGQQVRKVQVEFKDGLGEMKSYMGKLDNRADDITVEIEKTNRKISELKYQKLSLV
jgi:hypothetical protein